MQAPAPHSKQAILQWWPVIVYVIAIATNIITTKASLDELRRTVDAIEQRASRHESLPGHSEGLARLRLVEADSARHAEVTKLLIDKLNRIETNIAVLCQTIKDAQCVR